MQSSGPTTVLTGTTSNPLELDAVRNDNISSSSIPRDSQQKNEAREVSKSPAFKLGMVLYQNEVSCSLFISI